MLKVTKNKPEFIPDLDMNTFFGKGTKVGIFLFLIDTAKSTINI